MAGKGGFSVTVSLVDSASKQIDQINRKIAAMQAPVERMQKSLGKFADVTGLSRVAKGFQAIARHSLDAFQNLGRMVEPLAAIGGALSVAGIVRLTMAFGAFGAKLEYAAQRVGIASDQLQALQGAARLSGSSAEALTSGMTSLGDALQDAVAGRAPEVVNLLGMMGVSIGNLQDGARKAIDVLPQLADKIAGIQNPMLQAKVATMLFGGAGEQLLPFLRRGSKGIAEYTSLARQYGVVNEGAAKQAVGLQLAQTKLSLAVEGLGNSIGEQLTPVLAPVLTFMANWIGTNREWIASNITLYVKELRDYLGSIPWAGIWKDLKNWGGAVEAVAGKFLSVKTQAEVLLGFIATAWLARMVAPFVQLILLIGTGLTGALKLAGVAAKALLWDIESTPQFRMLTALLTLYEKLNDFSSPLADMAPGDPLWNAVPEEQQKQYPNSPWGQAHPGAAGAPARAGNDNAPPADNRTLWQKYAPSWLGGQPDPGTQPGPAPLPGPGQPVPGITPGTQGGDWSLNTKVAQDRAASIRGRLSADLGLSKDQAAAVVSQFIPESGMSGIPEKGGGSGFGWAQWTASRRGDFDKWVAEQHLDPRSDAANLGFLEHELKTNYAPALQRLKSGPGGEQGAGVFFHDYESGGDPRIEYAKDAHTRNARAIAGLPSPPIPPGPPVVAGAPLPVPSTSPGAPDDGRPSQQMTDLGALLGGMKAAHEPPPPANDVGPNVNINGGSGATAAPGNMTVKGSADLNVNFRNAPPGTTTTATSSGDLFEPPKIARAMTGTGP